MLSNSVCHSWKIFFAVAVLLLAWMLKRDHYSSYREPAFQAPPTLKLCGTHFKIQTLLKIRLSAGLTVRSNTCSWLNSHLSLKLGQITQHMNCSHECSSSYSASKHSRAVVCHIFDFFNVYEILPNPVFAYFK